MTTITRAATAAAICAAVLLTGTACSSDGNGPKTSAPVTSKPTASANPAADVEEPNGDTVTEAPKIGRKTIASFANGQFGRVIPVKGGLRKGTLGIALNCEGKGTVTVEVPYRGMTFTEECADGKVAASYNETEVSEADPDASYIHVTGTSGVRWSVSAGQ
ncbi:hypothetical protein ACKI1I_34225 [Streptomyces turgidiscabies]|uniref:Putative lipoprotein n=1 Tax=Streptomyces turgidiscabies (strain Car8) TaxID=698760 RepID=L7EZF0_STRT8|nr:MULTISPECIES: hypothetical protein [Streptomyces]ELP64407.1 putative lipoprotein [Streptomyces turgidiscabies Car8]MDX3498640.1 hypothetical protein [Streptomyces turgidiscabies]GAQ74936.1 hypothetical protein T45_06717 [Streptomyces turgidiscabies]